MSEAEFELHFSTDDNGYLRRECPFCQRQFKVPTDGSLESVRDNNEEHVFFCPYCGQQSPGGTWWTQYQVDYIHDVQQNFMNGLINKHLVRPLRRANKPGSMVSITAKELPEKESWLSVEPNDMRIVALPCCQESIKVMDDWSDKIVCHYCGFPHS